MRKNRWLLLALSLIVIVLLLIGIQQWIDSGNTAKAFSSQKARELVEQRYKGEVTSIKQEKNQYVIEMERAHIKYEVKLGKEEGEVLAFVKKSGTKDEVKENQAPPKSSQSPVNTEEDGKEPQTSVTITEQTATDIALKQVRGTVDDIDLETSGDTSYYLIEIDTADEKEAVVQIHAITGKVMSVTWDD
ncbi:PepSY domain-containing protein [Bacillus rubiinfantis]|uniref:PepSY domain-containing protein n=1 Tax=Bacillus rubiinfantis TaxID=1499680 RepID=UPI000694BCCC|nr:PepSY domain-containing protein [Bacillus rubiinfantis]